MTTTSSGARRPSVLFVTDLAYEARGRRYCDEDIFLTSRLRARFDLALCHPRDAAALLDRFDGVVVRNSGPVLHYPEAYEAFRRRAPGWGYRCTTRWTAAVTWRASSTSWTWTGPGCR